MLIHIDFNQKPSDEQIRLWSQSPDEWIRELGLFLIEWYGESRFFLSYSSGSTGKPKIIQIDKKAAEFSARQSGLFFGLNPSSTLLLPMLARYIGARMILVRAIIHRCKVIVCKPGTELPKELPQIDFTAFVPLQVYRILESGAAHRFSEMRQVLIGGAAIHPKLEQSLQGLETPFYSSYGMTETISHCAIRALNGSGKSDLYQALPGFKIYPDEHNQICIDCAEMNIYGLKTNDIAQFENGLFRILGRADWVINTGGVKIHPEQLEEKVKALGVEECVFTSFPDVALGQKLVLVLVRGISESLKADINTVLLAFERPKAIVEIDEIPLLPNGKIDRILVEGKVRLLMGEI